MRLCGLNNESAVRRFFKRVSFADRDAHVFSLFTIISAAIFICGCASYHVGNQSLYPTEIHTVYVPIFQSASFRRNLGERLTEAVMKEIENKTPYKVVDDPNADSVLAGRIVDEGKNVIINSRVGDPRELQVHIHVNVSWTDRMGRRLRESPEVPLPAELVDIQETGNVVPTAGQSITTAQETAIHRIAEQIVGMMEKPW
jgi:hypothetical protein